MAKFVLMSQNASSSPVQPAMHAKNAGLISKLEKKYKFLGLPQSWKEIVNF